MAHSRFLIAVVLLFVVWDSCSAEEADVQTMLLTAVDANNPMGIIRTVRMGADLNVKGEGGQTPLLFAVLAGRYEAVETLIDLGADVTIPEYMGYTVMHAAGFQGRAKIAKLLGDHGIDPMGEHEDGYYPIHRACWGNEPRHAETVKAFLDLGVPPNLKSGKGVTCLQMTQNAETRKIVEAAIEAGSDLGTTEL
jgi:uncharacterized protein